MPDSDGLLELDGKIVAVLPGTMFRVELPNGYVVLANLSGKLREKFIRIIEGDSVRVKIDPKDITKARIVYRTRNAPANPPAGTRPAQRKSPPRKK